VALCLDVCLCSRRRAGVLFPFFFFGAEAGGGGIHEIRLWYEGRGDYRFFKMWVRPSKPPWRNTRDSHLCVVHTESLLGVGYIFGIIPRRQSLPLAILSFQRPLSFLFSYSPRHIFASLRYFFSWYCYYWTFGFFI